MNHLIWLLYPVLGYLCGAVPFALLIGKAHGVDVRKVGSGNVGATNLGRTLGRRWGVLCFLLDVCKGLLPVLLAGYALGLLGKWQFPPLEALKWLTVAAAAMLGHIFPVWIGFKGGKGVATGLGSLLGFFPVLLAPALGGILIWLLLVKCFRYVGVASVAAAASMPLFLLTQTLVLGGGAEAGWPMLLVLTLLAALIAVKHRSNIQRTIAGTEPKVGRGQGA